MDYTLSNSYDTDAGTGLRMHEDAKAIPTVVSGKDMNSLIWSDMEIVKAAGLAGIQFDKANPASYRLLLKALRSNGLIVGVDTGAANAAVVNLTPAIDALSDGMVLWFKAAAANTGTMTLNVNAIGAKVVVGGAHAALQGGEVIANGKCMVVYSATLDKFILIECTGGALQIGPASQSQHAMQLGQATGRVLSIRRFTASTTYTPTPGTTAVDVLLCGGGGGGGGASASGASQASVAGGGGGGALSRAYFTANFSGAPITIGGAGAGSAGSNVAGSAGGASSFGTGAISLTAPGGGGGPGCGIYAVSGGILNAGGGGAAAGVCVGGTPLLLSPGNQGRQGIGTPAGILGGGGADGPFGGGPYGAGQNTGGASAGTTAYGSGGAGGCCGASSGANQPGGYGANGVCIIVEYA